MKIFDIASSCGTRNYSLEKIVTCYTKMQRLFLSDLTLAIPQSHLSSSLRFIIFPAVCYILDSSQAMAEQCLGAIFKLK